MLNRNQFPRLRDAFDDEVYGPIQENASDPNRDGFNFGIIVRDVHLDVDRRCLLNTEELHPKEASLLSFCGPGRWVAAMLERTPGGVFIVQGLRIAMKRGVRVPPEEMTLVFNRRAG